MQPAPKLAGFAEEVSAEVQSWPGVVATTHWQRGDSTQVDGAEFHLEEGGELGHIHLDGEFHLAMSKPLRARLVELKLARPFFWHQAWVTASIASSGDIDQAVWLFKLGYDRLCSVPEHTLFSQMEERASLAVMKNLRREWA